MLLILIFNIILVITKADIVRVCPRFWKEYKLLNGSLTKCVKPFYEMVGRDEAQRRCQQMGNGFDLMEVHSKFENDIAIYAMLETQVDFHLSDDFNDDVFNNNKPQLWIGPKRVPFGGPKDFQYNSGCGIKDFSRWHKGQPNDHYNNEDCVFVIIDDHKFLGQWNDYTCSTKMYYICQFVVDTRPPCNQSNYKLFETNQSNYVNQTLKPLNTSLLNHQNNSGNGFGSEHHIRPEPISALNQLILNPFKMINNFIDRIRTIFRV